MKESIIVSDQFSFFVSSQIRKNRFQKTEEFLKWFEEKKNNKFKVEEISFSEMDQWHFTPQEESLVHQSGKFFQIEGIHIKTNFGELNEWEQPIINQPEIGILGLLSKVIDGVRYFLMQAKMEPGNVNILQLSPTVQATKSNFSRVHKGKLPSYLEYFLDNTKSTILIDQLQTEQGARFFRKRNRNIVIDVNSDLDVLSDFCWLTLGEIKQLMKIDNFVNMDARSVLSTIPLIEDNIIENLKKNNLGKTKVLTINGYKFEGTNLGLIQSACAETGSLLTKDQIISWYTAMKVKYELIVEKIPLSKLNSWNISDKLIFNDDRYFSVIGVKVNAGTREVSSWTQPLIKDLNHGLLGFIIKEFNGIMHFLIQAKVEAGNMDIIELSPTVSCSNFEYRRQNIESYPPFFEYFIKENSGEIIFDSIQSEEGGRFYHMQNRNVIIFVKDLVEINLPENYCWMTLNQMMDFMRYGMFNIEARSLISCLNFNI